MLNAQEWLDENYPNNGERNEIKKLILIPYLNGPLDLSDFTNVKEININHGQITSLNLTGLSKLEKLRCQNNKLTYLNLVNCSEISELDCSNNDLTSLDFLTSLDSEKLKEIYISDNNIRSDLTPFSRFTNLKKFYIGNHIIYYYNQNFFLAS